MGARARRLDLHAMSHPLTIPRPIQHPLSPIATPSLLQSIVLHVATQAHNRPHLLQTPQTDPAVSPLLTTHEPPRPPRTSTCPIPNELHPHHALPHTPVTRTPLAPRRHRTAQAPCLAARLVTATSSPATCTTRHHTRPPWRLPKSDALHRTPPSPTSSTVVRAPLAEHQLRRSARASPTPRGPRCGRAAP